jgi:Arc/MetJ-type ribon-helix-helix transcriptional regulator
MTIELNPEQERVVDLALKSGAYRNSSEVMRPLWQCSRRRLRTELFLNLAPTSSDRRLPR